MTFHRPDFFLCVCIYYHAKIRVHISPLWISNVCFCVSSVTSQLAWSLTWNHGGLFILHGKRPKRRQRGGLWSVLTLFTYAKPSHGISLESPCALGNSSCFRLRIQELFNLGAMMRYYTDKTQTDKVYSCFWCFLFGGGTSFPNSFLIPCFRWWRCVCGPVRTGSPWWLTIAQVFSSPSNVSGHSFLAKKANWGRSLWRTDRSQSLEMQKHK